MNDKTIKKHITRKPSNINTNSHVSSNNISLNGLNSIVNTSSSNNKISTNQNLKNNELTANKSNQSKSIISVNDSNNKKNIIKDSHDAAKDTNNKSSIKINKTNNLFKDDKSSEFLNTETNTKLSNMELYNPWDNKIDLLNSNEHTSDFLSFLAVEGINKTIYYNENYINEISTETKNNTHNNNYQDNLKIESKLIFSLKESYNKTNQYYNELLQLEQLYERYQFEIILSKDKELNHQQELHNVIECLKLLNEGKYYILNLLKNTHLTDTSSIHVFYESQSKLLSVLKSLFSILNTNNNEFAFLDEFKELNISSIDKLFDLVYLKLEQFKKQKQRKYNLNYLKID